MTCEVDLLRRAADLLDQPNAWCQGQFVNSRGQHCAVGALTHARDHLLSLEAANICYVKAHRHLTSYVRTRSFSGVAAWNDKPERTKQEVVDTLRAAADELAGTS